MTNSIIAIDDDIDFLEILKNQLVYLGYNNIKIEDDPRMAAAFFMKGHPVDIALIDMTMPQMNGTKLLEIIKNNSPTTECIMISAVDDARSAVDCLKKGAYDYLVKPVLRDTLAISLKHALERKRLLDIIDIKKKSTLPKLVYADTFMPIVTQSRMMLNLLKESELHAQSNVPVLITGESGTGKELLAKAIHCASPRSNCRFTPVNMASVSASLFDSEFFGHTKGAFTGANNSREGHLEYTGGGTLFLDEISSLPLELQGKLLRVLQNGEYTKLGTSSQKRADVRFIAASNEDLELLIRRKAFRKDLFYRIRGGWLHLPPLKERTGDIPLLANTFLKELVGKKRRCRIQEDAMCRLVAYDYPGNVRELKSIIHAAVNLSEGKDISAHVLPPALRELKTMKPASQSACKLIRPLADVEKTHILHVYDQTGKNKSQTARMLGIGLNTLRRKLKTYGLP